MSENDDQIEFGIEAAVELIRDADAILLTSGAGIGIDSGLPDFRGENGFWRAYPALGELGISFVEIANPQAFRRHPRLAWGFYGHRLNLYRATEPHVGFHSLLSLSQQMPLGLRHFTSNVDGQFQKAGFTSAQVTECHGSIHYLQCMNQCGQSAWPARDFFPEVDERACQLVSALPTCPVCGGLARPNILMFGDWDFEGDRYAQSQEYLLTWAARCERLVVMEVGAGTAIPSARRFGASLSASQNGVLIRINPGEPQVARASDISIPSGAAYALSEIVSRLAPTS